MIPIPDEIVQLDNEYNQGHETNTTETNEYIFTEVLSTAPYDPRFPNQNQTKHCWQHYVDYQKCIRAKGADFAPCQHFKYLYKVMCPSNWIERWDELVQENRFPANLTPPVPKTQN